MKRNWRRSMATLIFGACLAVGASACVLRAQVKAQPYAPEAPPEPKYEEPESREGHVWIRGHWVWRNDQWTWKRGHWKRSRSGYQWRAGRWEKKGSRYHWVEGRWVEAEARGGVQVRDHRRNKTPRVRDHRTKSNPAYPTSAPPEPRYQNPDGRSGYVWIRGHYEWNSGKWEWKRGHWERAKSGKKWKPGRWVKRGDRYVWKSGKWVGASASVKVNVRDHRKGGGASAKYPTSAPPKPKYKKPAGRSGYIWIRGHYEWKNGKWKWKRGHWERAKSNKKWKPGRWVKRGDRYVWEPGKWIKAGGRGNVKVRDHRGKR